MKRFFLSLLTAFSMYSAVPVPSVPWNDDSMRGSICFFPAVGILIGAVQLLWDYLTGMLGIHALLRGVVLALLPVIVTGGIHADGMMDTADALFSRAEKEQKLKILKDPRCGSFAVITAVGYFLFMTGIMEQADRHALYLIGLGYILSRAYSGLALVRFRKAKETGLLRTFSDYADRNLVTVVMCCFIIAVSVLLCVLDLKRGSVQAVLALLVFAWYRRMSYREFGGITGDLAGFFLQMAELVMAFGVVLL